MVCSCPMSTIRCNGLQEQNYGEKQVLKRNKVDLKFHRMKQSLSFLFFFLKMVVLKNEVVSKALQSVGINVDLAVDRTQQRRKLYIDYTNQLDICLNHVSQLEFSRYLLVISEICIPLGNERSANTCFYFYCI